MILWCVSLIRLSLKSCSMTDNLIQELTDPLTRNKTLLHLNLSSNKIGNQGCIALATSLRLNRTLLTLSLTGNTIGDIGVATLAKVSEHYDNDFIIGTAIVESGSLQVSIGAS